VPDSAESNDASSGVYRQGALLIARRDAVFPDRCVLTNEPAHERMRYRFAAGEGRLVYIFLPVFCCMPYGYLLLLLMSIFAPVQRRQRKSRLFVLNRMIFAVLLCASAPLAGHTSGRNGSSLTMLAVDLSAIVFVLGLTRDQRATLRLPLSAEIITKRRRKVLSVLIVMTLLCAPYALGLTHDSALLILVTLSVQVIVVIANRSRHLFTATHIDENYVYLSGASWKYLASLPRFSRAIEE
jgi:hypothetical protein